MVSLETQHLGPHPAAGLIPAAHPMSPICTEVALRHRCDCFVWKCGLGRGHSVLPMRIERTQLEAAAQRGIISAAQASALWTFLEAEQAGTPQFSFNHLLYYLGGMVAIGGISAFVTLGWETLGGMGLFLVALAVMAAA